MDRSVDLRDCSGSKREEEKEKAFKSEKFFS
jgi:hypothetical protein